MESIKSGQPWSNVITQPLSIVSSAIIQRVPSGSSDSLARTGLCPCGAMPSFYFATKCPLEEECSFQAWKRAECWDYTEEKCRDRVVNHLTKSSLHLMDSLDATILAASVDMEVNDFEEEPNQHMSKRLRLLPPNGPPTANEATDVASVVADAIKSTLMVVKEELAADRAAANASNSHLQFAPPKALAQPDTGDLFCVNGTTLQTACEALDRSHVAAVHARRLCRAAANVFETEAQSILEAKAMIMEVLRI